MDVWQCSKGNSGHQCFMVPVHRRDAETLLAIINEHILPGTTIMSDQWATYDQLQNLGFNHGRVNHRQNFVDPNIHTQNVENLWGRFKKSHMKRT